MMRIFFERRFSFLLLFDFVVLSNYIFFGFYDLRILRIFRAYSIYSNHKMLLPTNTLLRTVYNQRLALLGSQIMVFSVLLIFSTLIHFIERDINPEYFGSIVSSMWFGIATLTTVGYGDVTPSSPLGQVLTSMTMFLGIGMFALPAAILASAYYEEIQKRNFLITMETISSIPLFSMLPIGALSKINDKLVAEIYPAKRKIIEKGDAADCMYIIEFGSVQVEIEAPVTLGQGDYFGEKGILSKELRNASISSLEEVKLLSLSKEDLEDLMEEYPNLFEELEKISIDRTG
tara:strand:- start:956 stop:1822 length:867 start_codon:yes stop_codon:yes gene_type:complete